MDNKPYYIVLFSLILIINESKCMDRWNNFCIEDAYSRFHKKVKDAQKRVEDINNQLISYEGNSMEIKGLKSFLADRAPEENKHKKKLFSAVKTKNYEELTRLLYDNADPNVRNKKDIPLIMKALYQSDLTSLAIILAASNVDPNLSGKTDTYDTPLKYAVWKNQLEATIMLCKAEAYLWDVYRHFDNRHNNSSQYVGIKIDEQLPFYCPVS